MAGEPVDRAGLQPALRGGHLLVPCAPVLSSRQEGDLRQVMCGQGDR